MEKKTRMSIIIGAVIVVIIGAVIGYLLFTETNEGASNFNTSPQTNQKTQADLVNGNENANSNANTNTSANQNTNTSTPTNIDEVAVSWNSPQPINSLKLFVERDGFSAEEDADYFSAGTVQSGAYAGGTVILVASYPMGPAFSKQVNRFVQKGGTLTLIKNSSAGVDETFDSSAFSIDETVVLPGLDFPEKFAGPESRQTFTSDPWRYAVFQTDDLTIAFTDKTLGDVYTTKGYPDVDAKNLFTWYGYYLKAADGTTRVYSLDFDFVNDEGIPQVTWTGGVENEQYYTYTERTGCGSGSYGEVMNPNELSIANDLKQTGTNSFNDAIYELKDANHTMLKNLYEDEYNPWEGEKIPYSEFVTKHPIFFWTDPFGRLIKFTSGEFIPAAECGKPVIYLYPEEEQAVHVNVEPKGGMSYSDPVYRGGWDVIAKSNGELIERATGLSYPYLFWEGNGGIYTQPEKGFVISQSDVHTFIPEKLKQLGLNEKEIVDFMEFWEPRMQDAPYYFVTFLGNSAMDQLAPLTVTPKPDTVIRILMDFSPLEEPKEVKGFPIMTPERKGFTVVEWGGVIR